MANLRWTPERAKKLAADVLSGKIKPDFDSLNPKKILEIAEVAVKSKEPAGYAEYADFADELFLEIMAGRAPNEIGWRLNRPSIVLQANMWTMEGRPTKFYPPKKV